MVRRLYGALALPNRNIADAASANIRLKSNNASL
jgi:hypothetical protein